MSLRYTRHARLVLAVGAVLSLAVPPTSAQAGPQPVNPSNQQLATAQARKQQAATALGQVAGQLALLQGDLTRAAAATDTAIATYNATNTDLQRAVADVSTANLAVGAARTTMSRARQQIRQYLHDDYVYGRRLSTSPLLTTSDPNTGLQAMAYQRYLSIALQKGLATAVVNTIALSNAEATQRGSLARAQQLQTQAETQKAQALNQLSLYQLQQRQLAQRRIGLDKLAASAAARLAGITQQRQSYQTWLAQQRALQAAEQARQEAIRRQQQQQQQQQQPTNPAPLTLSPPPPAAPPTNDRPWSPPLPAGSFFMSTCFCMRWGEFHTGDDLAAAYGTPIYAIGGGSVIAAGPAQGFGNWVIIDHGNGFFSIYGHMRVLAVSSGQSVRAGQTIAYVGSEGFSTGPHLHLEIRLGGMSGTAVDPQVFLARRGISI